MRKARGEKELDAIEFLKLVKKKSKELKFDEEKLNRQLNYLISISDPKWDLGIGRGPSISLRTEWPLSRVELPFDIYIRRPLLVRGIRLWK